MKVFKTCLTITRRHMITLLIYLFAFTGLTIVMTDFYNDKESTDFIAERPNYTLINRDKDSSLTDGLSQYLSRHGTAVSIEDSKEALQDASFFHASDYIAILPDGFAASMETEEPLPVDTVTIPDSAQGFYMGSLTDEYLQMYRSYQKIFPELSPEELTASVLESLSVQGDVQMRRLSQSAPTPAPVLTYTRLFAYICLVLIVLNITTILMVFRRPDLNLRHAASPLKPLSKNLQMFLFGGCVMLLVYCVLTFGGALMSRKYLAGLDPCTLGLLALNMLTFSVVSLSIAMLCSHFIRNSNLQNALTNLIALGLSFLGGIFVPLNMLGSNILQVAKLTPTYWYSVTCDRIGNLNTFSGSALTPVFTGIFIQLSFAAVLIVLSMVIARKKSREEQPTGTINTEYQL